MKHIIKNNYFITRYGNVVKYKGNEAVTKETIFEAIAVEEEPDAEDPLKSIMDQGYVKVSGSAIINEEPTKSQVETLKELDLYTTLGILSKDGSCYQTTNRR